MIFFKVMYGIEQHSPKAWIENGEIKTRLPDLPGEYSGCAEELITENQFKNLISKKVHDVVITEITEQEFNQIHGL